MVAVVAAVGAPVEIMEKPESAVNWRCPPPLLPQFKSCVTVEIAQRIVSARLVALRRLV